MRKRCKLVSGQKSRHILNLVRDSLQFPQSVETGDGCSLYNLKLSNFPNSKSELMKYIFYCKDSTDQASEVRT